MKRDGESLKQRNQNSSWQAAGTRKKNYFPVGRMNFIDNSKTGLNLTLRKEADRSKMHRLSQQADVGLYFFKSRWKSSIFHFVFSIATTLNIAWWDNISPNVWITELITEQDPILYLYPQKQYIIWCWKKWWKS